MSASTVNDEPGEGVYMSDSDSSSKRKGSPLQRDIPLKRQASFDDIYNTNLKGATQQSKKVDRKLKGKPASFSEMINISFQDPSSFTPILAEMVRPLIQETVNIAVEGIRSTVVADMIKSNESLQQTVNYKRAEHRYRQTKVHDK